MVSRITMDRTVKFLGKTYAEGEVFDSRLPSDCSGAIAQSYLEFLIASKYAHEQTTDEWIAQLGKNRKENIAACADPMRRAELIAADNIHSAMDAIITTVMQP